MHAHLVRPRHAHAAEIASSAYACDPVEFRRLCMLRRRISTETACRTNSRGPTYGCTKSSSATSHLLARFSSNCISTTLKSGRRVGVSSFGSVPNGVVSPLSA
eukprot:6201525-Pleurochrysis_carterae.AAC.2